MSSIFIGGRWLKGRGSVFQSLDPATQEVVWEGPSASSEDVALAFEVARQAFPAWARTPLEERVAILRRYGEELDKLSDKLPETISREVGKVLWETTAELGAMKGKVGLSIGAYEERTGHNVSETAFWLGGYVSVL